ncbi:MAG: HEAT repeat domain-containing protein [Anaerolineales bacterium]
MNLPALISDLLCGDDERAETAARELAKNPQESLPELYKLLASNDSEQRWWAVRAIAGCEPAEQTTRHLLAALEDESSEVRQAAALALCHRPDSQATPALLHALSDSDAMVASMAGKALALLKSDAVPALTSALESEHNPAARREIVRALAEIGDLAALPALMKALESDSALLQYWAEHGLEKLGLGMVYLKSS